MGQLAIPRCPCCGYRTGCSTCPVCYWTDDGQNDTDADLVKHGPNGDLSLAEARLNFHVYGAVTKRYADLVRPPHPHER